jgi:hypothetical protein
MRAQYLVVLLSLAACSSEDRGDGRKSTFAGNPGGPQAIGNNGTGPSFGENAGSGPSVGENAGSGPAFGENATPGQGADPTQACSKAAPCPAPARCTESSGLGFCITSCTLTSGADTETGVCPAGLLCIRTSAKSSLGLCLHTCTSSADCPPVGGLVASCESTKTVSVCVWNEPPTTTPTAPAGSAG